MIALLLDAVVRRLSVESLPRAEIGRTLGRAIALALELLHRNRHRLGSAQAGLVLVQRGREPQYPKRARQRGCREVVVVRLCHGVAMLARIVDRLPGDTRNAIRA